MKTIALTLFLVLLGVACSSTDGAHDNAQETCNGAGQCECKESCSHTCSGSQPCSFQCDVGATCSFSCPQGGCTVQGNGSATLDCTGGNCVLQCDGPSCALTGCTNGCRVQCGAASPCTSSCSGPTCLKV